MSPGRLSGTLINGQTGDAGLLVRVEGRRGLLLLDCGENRHLPPGDLVAVTELALSHAHIDHVIGFDHLLRLNLPLEKTIRVFGPPGITEVVGSRLAGYTWNKVGSLDVEIEVEEPWADGEGREPVDAARPADEAWLAALEAAAARRVTRFRCQRQFVPEPQPLRQARPGVAFEEPGLEVHFAPLSHGIVSFAYAAVIPPSTRVEKEVLATVGRPPGVWLRRLKTEADRRLARGEGLPAETPPGLLTVLPGTRLAYATDFQYTPANVDRVARLAREADPFFCEAVFLDRDVDTARAASHLTARQAGAVAARAGARCLVPFHFSRRYQDEYGLLAAEAEAAFTVLRQR
jgi:ribonuclease Z